MELDALADASLRIRAAQDALRAAPDGLAHAAEHAEVRAALEEAIADFTYVLDMTPSEFSRRVRVESGEGGVTPFDADTPADSHADILIRPIAPESSAR